MEAKVLRSTARPALPIPLLVLGVALFLPIASAPPLAACSCIQDFPAGDQPCVSYASAAAVFVGHVIDVTVREARPEDEHSFDRKLVILAVDEAFRGVSTSTVVVRTGMGGGDCGYDFRKGESYFVYAFRGSEGGPLGAGICGATTRLANAGRDLDYARRLARGDEIPGIYGAVTRESRKSLDQFVDSEPLVGVTVTVTGPGLGREPFRTVTDAQGFFQVAAGETVTVEPFRLGPPLPTRTFSGRLTRADGQPLGKGQVRIRQPGDEYGGLSAEIDAEGRFTATLFAGEVYIVEAKDWRAGHPNAFAETRIEIWDEDVTVDLVLELPR